MIGVHNMSNRRGSVKLLVPNGFDNLAIELKALLFDLNVDKGTNVIEYREDTNYNGEDVLWMRPSKLDTACQNPLFWNDLISEEIKSYMNFRIRIKSDVTDTPNDGLSNDNSLAMFYIDDSSVIDTMMDYISDADYQSNFVLTPAFVENISDIKAWIRERGIEDEFDMRRTDATLKEGVKNYYNLLEKI